MKTAAAPNSGARKVILVVAVVVTVCLLSLIVAGFTSLVSLAERIHPIAGEIVFWSVCLAAGFFALYAGLFFIVVAGLLGAPVLHRLMHRFHWDEKG